MGVENDYFWSVIGSRFGEPGSTPLPRIPKSKPPGLTSTGNHFVIRFKCTDGGGGGYWPILDDLMEKKRGGACNTLDLPMTICYLQV